MADVLAGLVVAFHELEAGFAVGFRRPGILGVGHVVHHDGDTVPHTGCTGRAGGRRRSFGLEVRLGHGLKVLGTVPCFVFTALGPKLDSEVATAATAGREENGGKAEHTEGSGQHTSSGVESVAKELSAVDGGRTDASSFRHI